MLNMRKLLNQIVIWKFQIITYVVGRLVTPIKINFQLIRKFLFCNILFILKDDPENTNNNDEDQDAASKEGSNEEDVEQMDHELTNGDIENWILIFL